jgi:sarcosine oxidase subunit gamma
MTRKASACMAEQVAQRAGPSVRESAVLTLLPWTCRYVLRGDALVSTAAAAALELPATPQSCRAVTDGEHAMLWLGPDEYLLLAPEGAATMLMERLRARLATLPHSLVDVSHRQCAFQVSGAHALSALSAGCPLDLDVAAFPLGMCTRTVLAKAEVVLWRIAADGFRLEVSRSFAAYVAQFMAEVMREFER